MFIAYVAVGLLAGSVAALAALLAGYSWGAVFALYVLVGNFGVVVAALAVALSRPARKTPHAGWQGNPPASSETSGAPFHVEEPRPVQRASAPEAAQSPAPPHPPPGRRTNERERRTSGWR